MVFKRFIARRFTTKTTRESFPYRNIALISALALLGPAYHFFGPERQKPKVETVTVNQTRKEKGDSFVKYIIIGAGTAGYSAMEAIKTVEPDASILMISDQEYVPYQRPPLSKELWYAPYNENHVFKNWQESFNVFELKDLDSGLAKGNEKVHFLKNSHVNRIDAESKKVYVGGKKIGFDKVLLATGGSPKNLPFMKSLPNEIKSKVTTFRTLNDYKTLEKVASTNSKIAVIGGGFLGSELAIGLSQRNANIVQIFPEQGNMGLILPTYLSKWTTRKVQNEGVQVLSGTSVQGIDYDESGLVLQLNNGESVNVDHVVVAVGLEPNVRLATASGLEIDPVRGGILVNAELEARSDVFAAGDVTSYHDIVLGRRRVEHYDHAVESGKVAGLNMVGAKKPYTYQSMFWSNLGPDVSYEAVGLIDSKSHTVSVWAMDEEKETKEEEHGKGVVYYLDNNKRVEGVLLWNLPEKLDVARKLIKSRKSFTDPNDLSGVIRVHQ